jgi:hypothetical protein
MLGLERRSGSYEMMKQEPKGLIYTITVGNQPIVALEASGREAGQLCKEEWFKSELAALKSDGEPVCGSALRLRARPATEEERGKYREGYKSAQASDLTLVYLIQLDDP